MLTTEEKLLKILRQLPKNETEIRQLLAGVIAHLKMKKLCNNDNKVPLSRS